MGRCVVWVFSNGDYLFLPSTAISSHCRKERKGARGKGFKMEKAYRAQYLFVTFSI